MATAGDLISGSLRLIGAIAEGETVGGNLQNDMLVAFNAMLDSWSTERLSVYATQDQQFTWPASTASRTLGASGDFVGTRPIQVDDATYFKDPGTGVSYDIRIINQEQYDSIALKTATSTYPNLLLVNYGFPNVTLTVYPVPTAELEWHIVSVLALSQPALWSTTLAFPPGYERALRFNFACEAAPEFGIEPSIKTQRIADVSKRALKRINNPRDVMAMPYPLVGRRNSFNIFAGDT